MAGDARLEHGHARAQRQHRGREGRESGRDVARLRGGRPCQRERHALADCHAPRATASGPQSGPRLYTRRPEVTMTDRSARDAWQGREKWAMVLGASSGFGGATAKAWAKAGFGIIGVHLDLRGTKAAADAVREEIEAAGVPVVFHNVNAADEDRRREVVQATSALFNGRRA